MTDLHKNYSGTTKIVGVSHTALRQTTVWLHQTPLAKLYHTCCYYYAFTHRCKKTLKTHFYGKI